jgi:sugar-specific transcriptional regulator TrmB
MDSTALTQLGLTSAESKIYYAVLKIGRSTVKDIAKQSGFHRTNIYDILEQLIEKGLVVFSKEGPALHYEVVDIHNLYELIDEKKKYLDSIFSDLEKIQKSNPDETSVVTYKGFEGMKSAFRDMMREKKAIYGFGLKGQLREHMPQYGRIFLEHMKVHKIPFYGIYTTRKDKPNYYTELRFVSKELSSPVATFIYGDTININIWGPSLVAIVIKSKFVAKMYKQHFNLLWKIAKN